MTKPLRDQKTPIEVKRCRPEVVARWEKMRQLGMAKYILRGGGISGIIAIAVIVAMNFTEKLPMHWLVSAGVVAVGAIWGCAWAWKRWTDEEERLAKAIYQAEKDK